MTILGGFAPAFMLVSVGEYGLNMDVLSLSNQISKIRGAA